MPKPLRDRLEVINLSSYTVNEKLHIAAQHLFPKQLSIHGLTFATDPLGSTTAAACHRGQANTSTNEKPPQEAANGNIGSVQRMKNAQAVRAATQVSLAIPDDVMMHIITRYTAESGVRELDRCLAAVCRWAALRMQSSENENAKQSTTEEGRPHHHKASKGICVEKDDLEDILGVELFDQSMAERLVTPGVAMGLAVSPTGGDILFIEATYIKGTGKLIVTGQLGDIMQESVRTAFSLLQAKSWTEGISDRPYGQILSTAGGTGVVSGPPALPQQDRGLSKVLRKTLGANSWSCDYWTDVTGSFSTEGVHRSFQKEGAAEDISKASDRGTKNKFYRLGIGMERFQAVDIHVHFPAGAIAKDGPSAGVATTVALASLFTGQIVRSDTAFSGEITLRGHVLAVGGIKEKVLAAHRGGLTRVVLPHANQGHLKEIPQEVLSEMQIFPIQTIDEALFAAFEGDQQDFSYDSSCGDIVKKIPAELSSSVSMAEPQSVLMKKDRNNITLAAL